MIYVSKHDGNRLVEVLEMNEKTTTYKDVEELLCTPYSVPTAYFINHYVKSSEYND